ncbi:uncharacterized protein LOC114533322 [Dendronephthya gigantea]|uniref:uncharacterized protein LOC114533322 n=1 Tax=Dendronephthya gigantea TaxID=151771 RepID=UPI00106CCDF6|nr:uncharacterized protein LOC114533322 [Dendronephthya gigantea]
MAYHLRFDKGNLAMQAVVLFVVFLSFSPLMTHQQEYKVVYKQIPDNRGTEFVVGFLQQFRKELDGATRLFITSDYNTRAVIKSRETNVRKEIEIKSRELYPVDFPTSVRMRGTAIEEKGIHIKADAEIVVYGLNIKKFTTDAYLALPVDIQSTKYIIPSFTPSYTSLIGIIAIRDRTTIFVTFQFADRRSSFRFRGRNYRHRDTLSVTLNSLQSFQISHTKDMSGTRIFSTKPISVFSGNECANVPTDKGYCDHLVEHIPPVNTWGQRFITAPLAGRRGGDFFRIMAANQSTDVRINGKYIDTLGEGKFIEVDVSSDRYQYIETSKPCLVVQFSKGQRVDSTYTDPFMVMIPPVEQYTAQYTISTPDQNEKYFHSYINIIIDTKEIDGLRLDGRSLREEKWVPVWGTTHSAAQIAVTFGVHRVMHDSPIVPFAVFLYGYARADSYGYPGGLRLADLTLDCVPGNPGDGLDNDCDRRIDEEIKNYIDDDDDGLIDEDLVTEPPRIILDLDTVILNGCPADVIGKLQEPTVISAPLCTSRGPFKLSFVDNVVEKDCVQYIDRMWLVRDGCGNLANVTQEIRIRRPEMSVTFPEDVRGKCHLGEDLSEVGEPKVKMSCRDDRFSVKYRDSPALVECIRRGRTIGREWTVKASCGSVIKDIQKLLPDVTPPKVSFVGKLQYSVKRDFRINWNASEESTFECSLDGPNNPRPCGKGWEGTFSKRELRDGKNVFWVRATDKAGNTGGYIRHPFQVDNTGPRLSFIQPLASLSRGPLAIKWRSNEMARFKCGLNPDRLEQCGSGVEGKDYRRDLQDGSYNFYVGAVDKVGNEARFIRHTFRIDSTPPRIKFGKTNRPTLNSRVDLPILSNEIANFSCSIDGQEYVACGTGRQGRFRAQNLAEGPHELRVKAKDEAGNVADPISLRWNSDKTSPNILFTPGLPTKFREKPKVTWTSTEYARFECALNDNVLFNDCGRGTQGMWTKERVPEGIHDFYVRGIDRHNNVGPTESFRFSIDNKYPIVYLNRPLPSTTSTPTETFRWTSNEFAEFQCAVDDVTNFQDCGSGTNGDFTTPSLDNGPHTFFLTAKDEVGNVAPRLSHSWDIDNVAPILRFTGELPNNVNKNKQRFSWTSSEYARFRCFIDSEVQSESCGSGNGGSWTSNELTDGEHTFGVFGTDEHGNQGPVIRHTWKIDTKAPKVRLDKVPETINTPRTKFSWKSSEESKFTCALDDGEGEECGEGTDGEYLSPTLVDGEHEFRLLVEDNVGNLAPLIRSSFNVDTSRPVITFDKPDPTTPEKDLAVTWKSSEDAEFECAVDDPTQYEECGMGKTGGFQKDDLSDGEHKLYVRGKDDVGNVGEPSIYTVTTDRTPPTARFTDDFKSPSKNAADTFTWSANEPVTFKCKVDEREETDCGEGTNGQLRMPPNLPDGRHVFQVRPIDKAENEGRTLERRWVKDTSPPHVSYLSTPPKRSKDAVTFKWSSTEPAEFECALDDTANADSCEKGSLGQKILTGLPKGDRVFWVRGKDGAGNVGDFVPHRWTVDINPPDIEFTGDLPAFSKKTIPFSWKSTEESKFECAVDDMANFAPCGRGMRGSRTLRDLTEGPHTFYVRARDSLDNIGTPISHSWTVDSTPPRAVVDPVDSIVGTPRVTLSWNANEQSKFYCAIGDVGNIIECGQGNTGSWTTPYLRRGPQKFWLIAEDYHGNRAEPVLVTWTVDNKAPIVTFSADSTTKSTTGAPSFSWTSDEPAKFQCAIKGVTAFEDCGTGTSGTWSKTNVPDGKRTFLVRARDDFGNQNDPYSFPFDVDTTPPTGFAVTGPPRRTNKQRATFKWRTSEDANYDCLLDQNDPVKCGAGENGVFTTEPLPDGEHDFSVVATDNLGNKAPIFDSKWTVDTAGPRLTFSDNLPTHTLSNPWFNWTSDEPADRFQCALDDPTNWELCGNGKTGLWQQYNVPDGPHRFFVRGTDDLGNTGPEISHPFTVDSTPPRISITTPPDTSSSTPTIRFKATEDVEFKCRYDDGEEIDCGEGTTGSWTGRNVPDGPRKLVIKAKDEVDNEGIYTYTWRKDSSAPAITFDPDQPSVTLSTPRFTWKSSEPARFECSLDGFETKEDCGSGTSGSWQQYKPDGNYILSVRGQDFNGNTGTPSEHNFKVDNTAPRIQIVQSTDLGTSTPNIRWTSDEDVNFECALDDGDFFDCGNGKTGSWVGRNLLDGPHKFVIRGKDPVLNTGQNTFTWNKDSSGPAITFDPNQPKITLRYPRFTWKSSEPANFECSLDGFTQDIQQCGAGDTGAWQRSKPDGDYELSVRGRDRNNNVGTPSTHSFSVDNTAPTIQISSRPRTNSSNPTIEWTSSEDVEFKCSLDYRTFFDCGEGDSGTWTGDNIPDGPHSFVIEGKDKTENRGRHTFTWTQDSVPPQIEFNQFPHSSDTSPQFGWTSSEQANFKCSLDDSEYEACGGGYDGRWRKENVPGGSHKFSVKATDSNGNVGGPIEHTWNIDATGPVISLDAPRLRRRRVLFQWTSNKRAYFYCAIDDPTAWRYCGSGTSGSRQFYDLSDGRHTFYVRGRDMRRNTGSPASRTFDVDNTPPNVEITTKTTAYSTRDPSFTWRSSENSTFKCAIDSTLNYRPCGDGFNGEYTASNVREGRHAFFVQGTDKAGNVGPHARHVFSVDTTGPRAFLTSNVPETTNKQRLRLSWYSNEKANFTCTVDDKTVRCGSGSTGQFTTEPLSNGPHKFELNLVDELGNKGTPVTANWVTDSSGPVISFDPNLPIETSRKPTMSWTSSEYAYYECDLDGEQRIPCGQGTSKDMTFEVRKGPHTFSVRGTDRNGNVGEWARHTFEADGDGPVISFPPDTPKVTKSNPTFRWTSSEDADFKCGVDNSFNLVDCGDGANGRWTGENIPDGSHVFIVYGTDSFNNRGPYAQHRFEVDNTVPVISFRTNPTPTNSKPQIRWTSSESARFQCSLNGQDYEDCGEGLNGLWTGENVPDGRHTFSVRGVDKNNNTGEPARFNWNVDNESPDVSITSNNPTATNDPRQTITWSSTEPATFECTIDGKVVSCGSGLNGRYTTPILPDGEHTFSVNAVDGVGNKGEPQVVKWTSDRRPPVVAIRGTYPSKTSDPTYKITWDTDEKADFECKLNGRVVECGKGTRGDYTTGNLPDGRHTFELNAVDKVGNRGSPQFVRWTKDTTGPILEITSNNPSRTNNPRQTITWESNEPADFECKLDDTVVNCGSGETGGYTTPNLPDGNHKFEVTPVDGLGNKGAPRVVTWTTDKRGPGITITSNNPPKTSDRRQTITWTSSEPANFECRVDGRVVNCGRGTTGQYTTTSLPDGPHSFEVNAVDSLGNRGTEQRVRWSTDTRGPRIQITNQVPRETKNKQTRITWSADEKGTFKCTLDDVEVPCGDGTEGDYTTPDLNDGEHTFTVESVDKVGNKGDPVSVRWNTDSTAPEITFPSSLPVKTSSSPRVTWTSSEDAVFDCALDDKSRNVRCDTGTSGRWNGLNIPNGPHTFWVRGTDNRGNVGDWTPYIFDVDSVGPDITFDEQPKNTRNNPTFTWSSSEPATFKCRMENSFNEVDCGDGETGAWTGNRVSDGPHKLIVYGVDEMNNRGPVSELDFNVDATGPVITLPPDTPTVTKKNPSFSWKSSEPAEFKCAVGDGRVNFVDCGKGTSGTWTTDNVPDGPTKFKVYGVDDMKNRGPITEHTFTVDNSGPTVRFDDAESVTGRNPQFTFSSDEDADFECSLDGGDYEECGRGRSGEWNGQNIPHGRHRLSVRGRDSNNNLGEPAHHSFNVDSVGPSISFRPNQPTLTRGNVTFQWTSSESAKFKCRIDDDRFEFMDCGEGTSGQWTGRNIPDGEFKFVVYGTDDQNNRGPTAGHKFTVDLSPPQITFSGDLPETTGRDPTLSWSSTEYATFECKLEDGVIFNCGSGERGSWTGSDLSDGSHSLSVRGTDRLGNTGQFISRSWVVDESGPRLRFVGEYPTRSRRLPRIRWTSNEYAYFECSLNDADYTRCGSGMRGSYTQNEIPSGSHRFRVRGRDNKGNVGEPISLSIEIDTISPTIKLLPPLPSKTKEASWTFTWSSDEMTNFTCAVNSLRYRQKCGFGMNGRFTTEPLPDGRHRFYLLGEDELGNNAKVVSHRWEVDKTKPEVEFLPNQPTVSDADITLLWKTTSNKPAEFECALDNVRYMRSCGAGTTGSWTNNSVPDGDHTLYVRAKDSFGDYGQIKSHSWKVDTKVPQVRLIGRPPRRSTYDTGSFYWLSDEHANYECAVDLAESGTSCGSGMRENWISPKLDDGKHVFYLFATDNNGNQANPVEYRWEIDTKPPIVTLDENTERVSAHNITLKWRANENAIFQCAVDSIFDNRDCGAGRSGELKLKDLSDGFHTVWIKAEDVLGNVAPWTKHTWRVDSKPPELDFTSNLPDKTGGDVSFFWRAKESTKFKCGTDPNNLVDCGVGHSGNSSKKNLTDGAIYRNTTFMLKLRMSLEIL